MTDNDRTTPGEQTAETPAPSRPGPGAGGPGAAPPYADQPRNGAEGLQAPEEDGAAELQGDLDEIVKVAAERDEYLALAQRTQADFENYRKRALRESRAAQERGAVKLAQALLPAIDDLDRALAHADTTVAGDGEGASNGAASLVAGLKHVHAGVISALGGIGIERYSPEGERFDPQFHEAVAQQPVEGAEPGVVVEVFQRGYRMGDTVVRPARVVVAG